MKILAIETYYGGSHKAFLDGWIANSRHDFTLLTLPPNKWKWRMRHAAITFAQQVNDLIDQGLRFDALFCSDMLNLAEFLGLVHESIRQLPTTVYFHENQLTYPVRFESQRDYHYVFTNMTTALAADNVWFNSAFHRDEFLTELRRFLRRMPDNKPLDQVDLIARKSHIFPPGIDAPKTSPKTRTPGPTRILWAARWEHDKNPEEFFAAIDILKNKNIDFRISVIGETFCDSPEVFAWAKDHFQGHIDHWGYQPTRDDYLNALTEADIVVSTANHEFFGISIAEAIAAGARPILPDRLAYPELITYIAPPQTKQNIFYDGTVKHLADKLNNLITTPPTQTQKLTMPKLYWPHRAIEMDKAINHQQYNRIKP